MSSPVKICMNELCGKTTTSQWKRGWPMKAGGVATLCEPCGTEYDNVRYCERFHLNESGWRECKFCDQPVHCGCIISIYLFECLDSGGITCIKCMRAKGTQPLKPFSGSWKPSVFTNRTNNLTLEKYKHTSSIFSGEFGARCSSSKEISPKFKTLLPLPSLFPNQLPLTTLPEPEKPNLFSKPNLEPLSQQSLSFSVLPTSNGVSEGKIQEKVPLFKQQLSKKFIIKPKSRITIRSQTKKGMDSDNRVAKQPAEGRGRSQLLPRYWPKITDQELLEISGDLNSNCTITPLFEKILSASDAGRIGRLVLPKACAEAYFPPINQSEGVPLKVQDIKGKEWTFQFRYWPNNNSRMYVLEGVTPCIQNMQMQAGDTVTFSRLDPGDKLVIGCRKAPISTEASALPNAVNDGPLTNTPPSNTDDGGTSNLESMQETASQPKKKSHNIGSKNKRLHLHSEDVLDLKFTWIEAQEFLRPPSSKPTVVFIENCELEEYDEPPVFGKKTIFTTNASRLPEQWVECDSCSKWRKLPLDVLIPSKWTCSDNVSDPNRCSCSAAEEEGFGNLRSGKEPKKRKITENQLPEEKQPEPEPEPTGLEALATIATSGENTSEPTTRHPRHRPGCSCIVCIQPPSGKGKHKPDCICTVCSTVRRRFKTLMLRKKNRLLEQQAQMAQKSLVVTGHGPKMMTEGTNSNSKGQELDLNCGPSEEEMMLAEAANVVVLAGVVPNGTSDVGDGPVQTNNKVVEK